MNLLIITGNVFTGVCDSVHGGVWFRGVPGQGGACSWGGVSGPVCSRGGVPGPRGGVSALGGGVWSRGCLVETPPGRLLLQAVHILLECIFLFPERLRRSLASHYIRRRVARYFINQNLTFGWLWYVSKLLLMPHYIS